MVAVLVLRRDASISDDTTARVSTAEDADVAVSERAEICAMVLVSAVAATTTEETEELELIIVEVDAGCTNGTKGAATTTDPDAALSAFSGAEEPEAAPASVAVFCCR